MRIALLLTALVSAAVLAAPDDFSKPEAVYLKSGKRVLGPFELVQVALQRVEQMLVVHGEEVYQPRCTMTCRHR